MEVGTRIRRYEVGDKLGSGGMGEVYLARDIQLDRSVALKILRPEIAHDEDRVRRFRLEARAVSSLNHPNIITVHEIIEESGKIIIVYEHVDGETLREKIKRNQLSLSSTIDIAIQIAGAMAASHKAGIVHRDIKPENIMVRKDGYAKILDFGLAKRRPSFLETEENSTTLVQTQKGVILGSISYMSPEQIRGEEANEKSDIWSLGVVLYEMLTGSNPFQCDTPGDSIAAIVHVEPKPIEGYLTSSPRALQKIVDKALRKDAEDRFQNMAELSRVLKAVRYPKSAGDHARISEERPRSDQQAIELAKRNTNENPTLTRDTQGPIEFPSNVGDSVLRKSVRTEREPEAEMAFMDLDGIHVPVRAPRWMRLGTKTALGLLAVALFLSVLGMVGVYFFITPVAPHTLQRAILVKGAPPSSTLLINGETVEFNQDDPIAVSPDLERIRVEIINPVFTCETIEAEFQRNDSSPLVLDARCISKSAYSDQ